MVNQRVYVPGCVLHEKNGSLSIICSINPKEPVFYDYRHNSNTQWDFVTFVHQACLEGYLKQGDYLVADNAAVHAGLDSIESLSSILDYYGVTLVFLPAYSPEPV